MKIWAGRVFGRVAGLDEETHGERSATSLLLSCTSSQFYWVFSYSLKKSKSNLFWTFELFESFDLDLFKDFDLWTSIGSLPGWPNSWSHGDGPDAHRHSMTIRYHNGNTVSSDLTIPRHVKTKYDKLLRGSRWFKKGRWKTQENSARLQNPFLGHANQSWKHWAPVFGTRVRGHGDNLWGPNFLVFKLHLACIYFHFTITNHYMS